MIYYNTKIFYGMMQMKKAKYTPYNFNEKYEYKTYINIGTGYKVSILGKKQKKNSTNYSDLDNYTSWKNYFVHKYLNKCSSDSKCNFMHYLNKKAELCKLKLDIIKVIAIPAYILEFTAFFTILSDEFRNLYMINSLMILLCFLIGIGVIFLSKFSRQVRFYKDCIEIINDNISSHQN